MGRKMEPNNQKQLQYSHCGTEDFTEINSKITSENEMSHAHLLRKQLFHRQRTISILSQDSFGSIIITPTKNDDVNTNNDDVRDIAPDGGWGWVILAAGFFNCVVLGLHFASFNVFYIALVEYFDADSGVTGWIGSIFAFTGNFLGIVIGALNKKFGSKTVVMIGALFLAVGNLLSSFLVSVTYLYFTYGVIGGMGHTMIALPTIVIVPQYFNKRRPLVTGLCMSGLSVGGCIAAPIASSIVHEFGLSGAYILYAGFALQAFVAASFFRPVELDYKIRQHSTKPKPNELKDNFESRIEKPKVVHQKVITCDTHSHSHNHKSVNGVEVLKCKESSLDHTINCSNLESERQTLPIQDGCKSVLKTIDTKTEHIWHESDDNIEIEVDHENLTRKQGGHIADTDDTVLRQGDVHGSTEHTPSGTPEVQLKGPPDGHEQRDQLRGSSVKQLSWTPDYENRVQSQDQSNDIAEELLRVRGALQDHQLLEDPLLNATEEQLRDTPEDQLLILTEKQLKGSPDILLDSSEKQLLMRGSPNQRLDSPDYDLRITAADQLLDSPEKQLKGTSDQLLDSPEMKLSGAPKDHLIDSPGEQPRGTPDELQCLLEFQLRSPSCENNQGGTKRNDDVNVDVSKDLAPSDDHPEKKKDSLWLDLIDFSVMRNLELDIFLLGIFMLNIGFIAFYVHYFSRVVFLGIPTAKSITLLTVMGFCMGVGRYTISFISTLECLQRDVMFGSLVIVIALVEMTFPLTKTFLPLLIYGILHGVVGGSAMSLQQVVLIDVGGIEQLSKTTGLLTMTISVALLAGIPLAGFIFDKSGSYDLPFYVTGSLTLVGGLILFCLAAWHRRWFRMSREHTPGNTKKLDTIS